MGRDLHYIPGSFYRVDDRTGFPTRAERTKREWNGFIVDEKRWEERQPQDLVRGVPDYQAVPDPRPLTPNRFVGPTDVSLAAPAGPGATTVLVASTAGFSTGNPIGVMLDDGQVQRNTVAAVIDAETLELRAALKGSAGSDPSFPNLVFNYSTEPTLELPTNFRDGSS